MWSLGERSDRAVKLSFHIARDPSILLLVHALEEFLDRITRKHLGGMLITGLILVPGN